jgi:hypothetical protein
MIIGALRETDGCNIVTGTSGCPSKGAANGEQAAFAMEMEEEGEVRERGMSTCQMQVMLTRSEFDQNMTANAQKGY